jgi:hypothetical protein
MFFFAMPYDGAIVLSDEHLAMEWREYQPPTTWFTGTTRKRRCGN